MLIEVFPTTAGSFLDYYLDWTAWLGGDTIVTSTWTATGGTVTLSDEAILGGFTRVWSVPAVAGELIDLTNAILTAEGRVEEGTLRLVVRE